MDSRESCVSRENRVSSENRVSRDSKVILRGSIFGSLFTFKYSLWKLFIFMQIVGFEWGFNLSLFKMVDHLSRYYRRCLMPNTTDRIFPVGK